MDFFNSTAVSDILSNYGYAAIFLVVMLESAGIPLPGETILVAGAIYAGTKHGLDIRFVVLAAACGAILGDNIGFWVGREFGGKILTRFGPRIGLDARKQTLGQYLFKRFGGAIVFFGRFVAMLRTFAALLAGINRLGPMEFFIYNAAGGIVWASIFGFGGYLLGQGIEKIAGPVGWIGLAGALIGGFFLWRFYKVHEERLLAHAEREMGQHGKARP